MVISSRGLDVLNGDFQVVVGHQGIAVATVIHIAGVIPAHDEVALVIMIHIGLHVSAHEGRELLKLLPGKAEIVGIPDNNNGSARNKGGGKDPDADLF